MGIGPLWFTVAECFALEAKIADRFVLPLFEGPLFDHLSRLHMRFVFYRCQDLIILTCYFTPTLQNIRSYDRFGNLISRQ